MGTKDEVKDVKDVMRTVGVNTDAEIRHHVIDRIIDAGGEVLGITVDRGAVRLRGRIGMRDDIALVERLLRAVDGVTDVDAQFTVGGEQYLEPESVELAKPARSSRPARG
jgi:osmotically-inducible protein OsmY